MRSITAGLVLCWVVSHVGAAVGQESLDALNARVEDLFKKGDYAAAAKSAEQALALAERRLGKNAAEVATPINNLASIYEAQGLYDMAEPLYERALAIREKSPGPNHPHTGISLTNLAGLRLKQGDYARAEPLFKRSVAIFEKSLGANDVFTASALNNLAELYNAQGDYVLAEPCYKRALAILEKVFGQNHPNTATLLNNLAGLYLRQEQYSKAEPLLKRALTINEQSKGPDHPATATSLNNLAELYREQGMFAEAEPLLRRALPILENKFGPDHPNIATNLNNLAELYREQGDLVRAEPLYARALTIRGRTLPPDHPDIALTVHCLATMDAARDRVADAATLFDRSRHHSRRHVADVLPALSAAEQTAFLRTWDWPKLHRALSLVLIEHPSPDIISLSAGWLANGKAVAQEAASQQIILARQSEKGVTQAAVAALERVRADLAKFAQMPAPADAATYQSKLAALQAEEHRLVHEIGGQLAAIDRDEPWVEIDSIRKNTPAGSVLVDIARFSVFDFKATGTQNKWQPPRYAAWIVPPEGQGDVTVVDLGPAKEIDAAVEAYREAIEAVQRGGFARGQATAEDELKITAAPLSTKVLQPIIDAIGDATDIILSPDGSLWLVPWQALPLADGSYAIEKFAIRTVTSARDLVAVPVKAAGGKGGPVVVADPAFDVAPPASNKPTSDATRALAPASALTWKFSPLPGTRAEAMATKSAIAKVAGGEPRVLLGVDANETKLKQAAVRPTSLMLATHGFFKPDQEVKKDDRSGSATSAAGGRHSSPALTTSGEPLEDPLLRCGLALAGANAALKTGVDDGILTGAEIVGLDLLGTDLVVLSACETGVGKVQVGEGVAGLRQAFQIAGAKTVVATLWQVPDAESAEIMAGFYAGLADGKPPSKALREAQLAFIKQRREDRNYEAAHPYLWAAYGVTGR